MSKRPTLRVGGIPVGVDLSWVVISTLVVVAIGLRVSWDGTTAAGAIGAGLLGAVLLVIAVAAHELAHAVVARRRGLQVSGVMLYALGGYTEMEDEPADHRDELAVAVAGPVASLLLGGILWVLRQIIGSGPVGDVLGLMAVVNLAVAGFNLLPGLPLDGGRVLRSLVWRWTGDPRRGTAIAVASGQVLGGLMALAGVGVLAIGRKPAGLWALVVGWFLAHSATAAGLASGPGGAPVSSVMVEPGAVVSPDDLISEPPSHPIPVVDGGRVVGVVRRGSPPALARDTMIRLDKRDMITPETTVGEVARRVKRTGRPAIVVVEGLMVGVVTAEAVRTHLRG